MTDQLQAAADRGELVRTRKVNQEFVQAIAERRWVILQVVEIAKARPISPKEFRELCEYIFEFTSVPVPAPEK
jgi:hypothetical protein